MNNKIFLCLLAALALAVVPAAHAQPRKPYRVGVIHEGGAYFDAVEGLKDGLKELGLQPGKDVVLEIRDLQGNPGAVGDAARSLEQSKVDVLYCLSSSVTIAAKAATKDIPIVFAIGADAVADGLVTSLARPGGRLTGVSRLSSDFTAKRLEILKEIIPKLHRVATFYSPSNSVAVRAAKMAQEAGRQLKVEIEEQPVGSVAELRQAMSKLDPKHVEAFVYVSDAMVTSQSKFIIDTANAKKLATMFSDPEIVTQGALVGYGVNRYDEGKLSAKYVQRVLTGTSPRELPVESFSRFELGINLQTARKLGITIPQAVLFRADKVVE